MGIAARLFILLVLFTSSTFAQAPAAESPRYPQLPSEIPAEFKPVGTTFDHERRTAMIPMRDGVRLYTVILLPRGAKKAPILMTRTPYSADDLTNHRASPHMASALWGYDNATDVIVDGGYIRVVQDVRGRYGSEGDYVMNRPPRGPMNPTPIDHATDTYDTIEWLLKNVPESNGRVGIIGISYDGFLALAPLTEPHPALKVAVPMNPMVDGWMGDDWFHNGAFRQQMLPFMYTQQAHRKSELPWWSGHFDDFNEYMKASSAGELGRSRGLEQTGFWRKILEHPNYDAFWQQQAMDKVLGKLPLKLPVMLVHGLWDQEDIYGAPAVYRALEPKDTRNDLVYLVMGPWNHGQQILEASSLGALKFNTDTALWFRQQVLRPFLDRYLKDGAPTGEVAAVTAYETGSNRWERLNAWPSDDRCPGGCKVQGQALRLMPGGKATLATAQAAQPQAQRSPAAAEGESFTEYISDPAKPVPFRARPIQPIGYDPPLSWTQWLVDDQREASGRTDVAVFVTDVLTQPVAVAGMPVANLLASTSGTDSDWVVKLIDLYPDEVASDPRMGGYQLMVSADIFRGRFRESFEHPKAITPNTPLLYKFALPTVNHVFRPGHRIMVQVHSSWFPLYDRNPQTFVPNIFWAKPGDYKIAVQRIHHPPANGSFIDLPMVSGR